MAAKNIYSRNTLVESAKDVEKWDVIVIGGGATGLGVALDSVTRGYKTLLLEQVDFAKGTSSRSTKLVHGGVRYLAQGNIDLVKEALYERGLLSKNAPHLVKNQSFVIPNYRWYEGMYYTIGLKAYDFLAGKLSLGKSKHIKKEETLKRVKTIRQDKLRGGVVYQDGQFDDSRLAINVAQTCVEHGASILNYFKVNNLIIEDKVIKGVAAKDMETGEDHQFLGDTVINATGVFTDDILKMANPNARNMVKPSQGVHLVFDKSFLPGEDAIMIPKTDDGRVLFAVPWHDKVIVGTTDTPLEEHCLEPQALDKEVEFILKTFNNYLEKKVTRDDIRSIYAGLRPLAAPKDGSESSKEISRSHKILVSETGLITITGGKWTTFRRMAQDTVDKAISLGKLPKKECKTMDLKIHGAKENPDLTNHLYIYGSDQPQVHNLINEDPTLGEKLHPRLDFLKAEVVWAVRHELARTIDDVLARRVRMLFMDAKAAIECAPEVAKLLAKETGKDEQWINKQISDFKEIADHYTI
ncbi:glycerol-3-phosphate dehydrogenase/oxidase [Zunongwangia sp. HRR-M8]|uniref:glycerol-3-phosphate dehydrogenase/oxidase n=1 Tax=Zunongwangia sp. HRR-M8 TaxID=3015170 RepID=UPI0022DD7E48|nr:glycerol-3-phosphate dehydrogenase/oxidase [Zunongwangia sp. HRR-M8]WBL22912.1 glycerol-3-phosphate dehydrogenase/oxidase [Zunongwangia sp. HRR-M8]